MARIAGAKSKASRVAVLLGLNPFLFLLIGYGLTAGDRLATGHDAKVFVLAACLLLTVLIAGDTVLWLGRNLDNFVHLQPFRQYFV